MFGNRMTGVAVSAGLVAMAAGVAVGGEHTLRSDNGVYELSYTVLNSEAMIGNYYRTPSGLPLEIDRVEVALGFGQGGRPFEVLVYQDPDHDGNPGNAVLLSRTPGTIIADGPDPRTLKLQTVSIDPVMVEGGFFVAVRLIDQPYTPPNYNGGWETAPSAYRNDYSVPTNNWRITGVPSNGPMGGITPINVNNLAANFTTSVQLNWVIRVTGTTEDPRPTLQADMNGDGRHDMFDIAMFLDLFQQNRADFNGDGVTDFFDFAAFLAAWHQSPV